MVSRSPRGQWVNEMASLYWSGLQVVGFIGSVWGSPQSVKHILSTVKSLSPGQWYDCPLCQWNNQKCYDDFFVSGRIGVSLGNHFENLKKNKDCVMKRFDCAAGSWCHYSDVIMSTMESSITSLTIVYSTVYPGANQRKHQSSTSLAFVRGIHPWAVIFPHKGAVTRKMLPFDDVIMRIRAVWFTWRCPPWVMST